MILTTRGKVFTVKTLDRLVEHLATQGIQVWHEAVLKDREEAFSAGKVLVSDWDQAKKRIKFIKLGA